MPSHMKQQTRSLLEEINNIVPARDVHSVVESRARQVIASVANLVELIESGYSVGESDELIKRLFSSMKTGDERKFIRGIRFIKEATKK